MTAISASSAALASSLRGAASPQLYTNSEVTKTPAEIVASAVANGPQNLVNALANVAQPDLHSQLVDNNIGATLAAVVAGTTGSSTNASDLIQSSNHAVDQQESRQPVDTTRFSFITDVPSPDTSKPDVPAQPVETDTTPATVDTPPPVQQATGENNNSANTETVITTAAYTQASGAYSAAASFTASAGASRSSISISA